MERPPAEERDPGRRPGRSRRSVLASLVALGSVVGAVLGAAVTGIRATAQPRTGVAQSLRIISTTTVAQTFPIISIPILSLPLPSLRTVPPTKDPQRTTTVPVTITVVVVEVTTTVPVTTSAPTTTAPTTTLRPTTTRPTTTRATTTTRTSTTTSTTSTTSTSTTTTTTTTVPLVVPSVVPGGRVRLALDAAITRPSRVVTARGVGFTPGKAVRVVRLAGAGVGARELARGRVEADGTFRVPVLVMPGELPRRWTVQATDASGRRARAGLLVVMPPQVPDRRVADRSRVVQR